MHSIQEEYVHIVHARSNSTIAGLLHLKAPSRLLHTTAIYWEELSASSVSLEWWTHKRIQFWFF